MSLPAVSAWIIDFRTADSIFSSGSNARIDHCIDLCQQGQLLISHHERDRFKRVPALKACFLDDQNCVCIPDDAILQKCLAISKSPIAQKLFTGNDSALFIAATAASRSFGVISDHRSPVFATVYDLCTHYGVPIFAADEYFEIAL